MPPKQDNINVLTYLETLLAIIFAFWLCAPEFRLNHKITPASKRNAWNFQKRRIEFWTNESPSFQRISK